MRSFYAGFFIASSLIGSAQAFSLFSTRLDIEAVPNTATIFRLKAQDSSLQEIGKGTAQLTLDKNDNNNTIVVRQEGYRDVSKTFHAEDDYKDTKFTIFLKKRIVKLTSLPYDAKIMVNGEYQGTRALEVEVSDGQTTTIEVTKPGFATVQRIYRWTQGSELPPTERIELQDRKVSVTSSSDGVEFISNDAKVGEGDLDFIIKRGTCAKLTARKAGWIAETKEYCNKDGQPEPPVSDKFVLKGRITKITAVESARIFVNEKLAGTGSFSVQVPFGTCASVRVRQPGFLTYMKELCAKPNEMEPPLEENVVLKSDASFAASMASDQANINFTIEVGKTLKEEQAWKLLSSIVLNYFDVLDNSDSQTGYLRSAWQIKSWGVNDNSESMVRTRVILKRINDLPLRYSLKIVSEKNKDNLYGKFSSKDDENFEPWDRILNTYKDLISEAQGRLK